MYDDPREEKKKFRINKEPIIFCTIQEPNGKITEIEDVSSIWCDGVELHLHRDGTINILVRQKEGCLNLNIPIAMRESIHNKEN